MTKEEILGELQRQKEILHERFHVKRIGLFGSFASNLAHAESDIDLVVEFDVPLQSYISNRYALLDFLHSLFKRPIDLANPKSLKPYCKEAILKQVEYV